MLIFILSLFSFLNYGHGQDKLRNQLLEILVGEYQDYEVIQLDQYFKVKDNMFNCKSAIFQSKSLIEILDSQSVRNNPITVLFPPVDIYSWIEIMKNQNNIYPRNKFPEKILYGDDLSCKNIISYKCYKACLICSGQYFVTQNKIDYNIANEEQLKIDDGSTLYGYKLGSINTQFQEAQIKAYFNFIQCNYPNISYDKSSQADKIKELIKTMDSIDLKNQRDGFNYQCPCSRLRFCAKCYNKSFSCSECLPEAYELQGRCLIRTVPNCEDYYEDLPGQQGCQKCKKGFIKIGNDCVEGNTCPKGQYLQNGICCKFGYGSTAGRTCDTCYENCQKCYSSLITSDINCVECDPYYISERGKCKSCGDGLFSENNQCKKCTMQKCKRCNSLDPQDCQQCLDGFILNTGLDGKKYCAFCTKNLQCPPDSICQDSWEYRSQESPYNCEYCGLGCIQCFSDKSCQQCKVDYVLHSGKCQRVWYDSTYLDPLTNSKKACNFACSQCSDHTNLCDECSSSFSYYIEKNGKKLCFEKCPLYYFPSSKFSKLCEFHENLSVELQQTAKSNIEFERNDMLKNSWVNTNFCPPKCEECAIGGCILCTKGYFWNKSQSECQKCHVSCFSCKGPTLQDCISCSSFSQILPFGQYGSCSSVNSQIIPIFSYKDIINDEQKCKNSYKTIKGYETNFNTIFSSNDPLWSQVEISKNCQFSFFQKLYAYISIGQYKCEEQQIAKQTIQNDGQLIVLLTIILSQLQLKQNGLPINPQSLLNIMNINLAISTKYLYKPEDSFDCSQLKCNHSINESKLIFEFDENTNLLINKQREITFKTNSDSLSCDLSVQNKQVDQKYLNEFEDLITNSSQQPSGDKKLYFILNVCGQNTSDSSNKPIVIPVLIVKQLGQGFFQFVHPSENKQIFTLFISGANQQENNLLKKCYPSYNSPFVYYKVQSVKVYEIRKQGRYKSSHESQLSKVMFQIENQSTLNNTSTLCKCGRPHDFIILNDRKGGLFNQIDNSDNILTSYIKKKDMIQILSNFGVKDISISNLPKNTQQRLFEMYIDNLILNVKKCYPLETFTQCIQNVLIDIAYTTFGQCLTDQKIESALKQATPASQSYYMIQSIQKTQWCLSNKFRCQKNIETLSACY